jgi:hypothetical protein
MKFLAKLFVVSIWLFIWLGPQLFVYDIDSHDADLHFFAVLLKALVMLNVLFMGTPLLILLGKICPNLVSSVSNLPNKFDKSIKIETKKEEKHSILPKYQEELEKSKYTTIPIENWHSKDKLCGIYCILNLVTKSIYMGQAIDINFKSNNHFQLLFHRQHPNTDLQKEYNTFEGNIEAVYRTCVLSSFEYMSYEKTKPLIIHELKNKIKDLEQSNYFIHNLDDFLFDEEEKSMVLNFEKKNKIAQNQTLNLNHGSTNHFKNLSMNH